MTRRRGGSRRGIHFSGVDSYEYALGVPTLLADPSGLAPNRGEWAKKAFKCAWRAGKKCAGKIGKEFDMCYWSEFGNCMAKAWTKASCESNSGQELHR